MTQSPCIPLADSPAPVEALEASVPVGFSPIELRSFRASLMREGCARVEGNFNPFTVTAGELVLMRPGTRCMSISLVPVEIAVVQVDPVFLVDQLRWIGPSQPHGRHDTYRELCARARQPVRMKLDDKGFLKVADLFTQLVLLSKHRTMLGRRIIRATELIWTIESLLMATQEPPSRERSIAAWGMPPERKEVVTTLHAIHEHYATNLSIAKLAREVALSESALRRAVRASTGFSPRQYLHRVRLARFAELVAETSVPLAEAARMVGWASDSHARTMFERGHGMSPSEFRAEAQEARRADWRRSSGAELDAPHEDDYSAR